MLGDIGAAEDVVQDAFGRLIREGSAAGRFDVRPAEHRRVTDKFIAACATGDLQGLLAVLAPDVWGYADLGAESVRRPPAVTGAPHAARNLLHYWDGATFVSLPVNGQPAVLAFTGRRLDGVLVFTVDGELITSVQVIAIGAAGGGDFGDTYPAGRWHRSPTP